MHAFFYLKNNSSTLDINVNGLYIRTPSNETLEIKIGDTGTPSGGTAYTPVNLYSGSGNLADVTCQMGNNITGLSGGSVVRRLFTPTGNRSYDYPLNGSVVIPANRVLTMYAVTGSIQIDISFIFDMHTVEDD